jgi:hypothetical protein
MGIIVGSDGLEIHDSSRDDSGSVSSAKVFLTTLFSCFYY